MLGRSKEPDHAEAIARAAAFGSSAADLREEVLRIVSSPAFKGSRRTQQLLEYIVENGLAGRAERLKERTIGVEIFGRPATYVTGEDSIVRVTANDLRKRLNQYYRDGGAESRLKIELPPGSYVPVFTRIGEPAAVAAVPRGAARTAGRAGFPAGAQAARLFRNPWVWAVGVSWLSLLCACLLLWSRANSVHERVLPSGGAPPWPFSRVFAAPDPTEVVLADASYGSLRMRSRRPPSLDDYLSPQYPSNLLLLEPNEADARLQRELAGATLTSFADVSMVVTVLRVAGADQERVRVRSARDFRVRDNEQGNSILVGGPTSNPWTIAFGRKLNFYADGDGFRNKAPKAGERAEYTTRAQTGEPGEDYALIALVPASNRQRSVLLVQGIRQEGTEAASLFLREPEQRKRLRERVGLSDDAAAQAHFEVLLHTRMIGGAPGATDIVATRVYR